MSGTDATTDNDPTKPEDAPDGFVTIGSDTDEEISPPDDAPEGYTMDWTKTPDETDEPGTYTRGIDDKTMTFLLAAFMGFVALTLATAIVL